MSTPTGDPSRRSARVSAKDQVHGDAAAPPTTAKKSRGRPRKAAQATAIASIAEASSFKDESDNTGPEQTIIKTEDTVPQMIPTVGESSNHAIEDDAKPLVAAAPSKPTRKRGRALKATTPPKAEADSGANVDADASTSIKLETAPTSAGASNTNGQDGPSKVKRVKKEAKAIKEKKEKEPAKPRAKGKGRAKMVDPNEDRYARVEASGCPQEFFKKFKRAISQRMFMVDRQKGGVGANRYEEFKILGSTGNVYTTRISTKVKCDCPDYLFHGRVLCKHTIFVFIRVLKVPDECNIWYRGTLLPDEIEMVFEAAPPNPHDEIAASASVQKAWRRANGLEVEDDDAEPEVPAEGAEDAALDPRVLAKRMEAAGEDCPVCYEEMTQDDVEQSKLIYDETPTGCGKPLHRECFDMWVQTAARNYTPVTCVWCRSPWPVTGGINESPSKGKGKVRVAGQNYSAMGYLNMAEAAGMSRPRDMNTWK